MQSAIYKGSVAHCRLIPFRHQFVYPVFWLLLDLDEWEDLSNRFKLFGLDRLRLFSASRKDHGPRNGQELKPWIDHHLKAKGYRKAHAVRLLCLPRCLGWGFDPISVYFCYDRDNSLFAIVHEVKNTFGGQRPYVLPVADIEAESGRIRQGCEKDFFVSPFVEMKARYAFTIEPPADSVCVAIREYTERGLELVASLRGRRLALCDRNLLKLLPGYCYQSFKVFALIHWHALLLWKKGAKYHSPNAQHAMAVEGPSASGRN